MEARERDLEKYAKELLETELFDPARTAVRGITVHGSALRLDEDGLMFDARRRYYFDKKRGEVVYTKDQMAVPMDMPVSVGKPLPEDVLLEKSIVYGLDTAHYKDAKELWEVAGRIFEMHVKGGLIPELVEKKE